MSYDHLMLTEPEMIPLAVLWELSLQLSCGEQGTASREEREERRKATAGPCQYPCGNRECLRVLKEKEIIGHSRRKWSSIPHRLEHKDAVPGAQPYLKRITMDEALGEGNKEMKGILHPVAFPFWAGLFFMCQTLQREFEETSRVQAWQRGQGGRGDSTVRTC